MPSGGRQPGAGRPPGSKSRTTIERELMAAKGLAAVARKSGRMPLDVILAKMDGDATISEAQFQAAVAAAPYIHPRLASTDTTVKSDNVHRVVSDKPITVDEWTATHAPANDQTSPPLPEDDEQESGGNAA
jgi:hypothetical protein